MQTVPVKQAKVYGRPYGIMDDGRCLGFTYELCLNDHSGNGFWHGGKGCPNHFRPVKDIEEGKVYAEKHGYTFIGFTHG